MEKVIHICDLCKSEKIIKDNSESDYRKIKIIIGEKGSMYVSSNSYASLPEKTLLICNECQVKHGIVPIDGTNKVSLYKQPELVDRIFEIVDEIASTLGYIKQE